MTFFSAIFASWIRTLGSHMIGYFLTNVAQSVQNHLFFRFIFHNFVHIPLIPKVSVILKSEFRSRLHIWFWLDLVLTSNLWNASLYQARNLHKKRVFDLTKRDFHFIMLLPFHNQPLIEIIRILNSWFWQMTRIVPFLFELFISIFFSASLTKQSGSDESARARTKFWCACPHWPEMAWSEKGESERLPKQETRAKREGW